jgi:monoamine oxidase
MNRRDFLKHSMLLSLGALLPPSLFLSGCAPAQRPKSLEGTPSFGGKVLVVGAGASGLYAGYLLRGKGVDVTILEASAIHGGRLGKVSGFADYDIDTGAEWLHGKNHIIGDLVKRTRTKVTQDTTELQYWFKNKRIRKLPKNPFIFDEDGLPDISFRDYARQQGFGTSYDMIIEAIAGDQGADASLLSAYWNHKDEENWSAGDSDYKFQNTYFDLIDQQIAAPIADRIQYNCPITHIDYGGPGVRLTDAQQREYVADKVIIAVPISILQRGEIAFSPALPSEKTAAFAKFGMGPGMKVFLKFRKKFYVESLYGGPVCAAYFDNSIGKKTSDHVLLAFVMGDQAAKLSALGSDDAITKALLAELDVMYKGKASKHFLASCVQDVSAKPFIKGAYSYSTIGMGNARKVAAEPVGQKLFFAGEAMNTNGHHQTVQGAAEAAHQAVYDLLAG